MPFYRMNGDYRSRLKKVKHTEDTRVVGSFGAPQVGEYLEEGRQHSEGA